MPDTWTGARIQRVDPATGTVETVYTECDGHPLRAPNDLVFDGHGGFWFTDHGVRLERTSDLTGVYYAAADGIVDPRGAAPARRPQRRRPVARRRPPVRGRDPHRPGLRLGRARARRGHRWRAARRPTATCSPGCPGLQLLDSLAVDGEGHVCVGTLGNGGITVISPDGSSSTSRSTTRS